MNANDLRTVYRLAGQQNLEQGTFLSRNTDGTSFQAYALNAIRKRPIDFEQLLSLALESIDSTELRIWQDDLDNVMAPMPKVNDWVIDADGVNWIILSVDLSLRKNVYKCAATKAKGKIVSGAPTFTSFAVTGGPSIINSTTGYPDLSLVITGTNLTPVLSVAFAGASATFVVNSGTQITATIPTGAASGTITLTTLGNSVTSPGPYTATLLWDPFTAPDGTNITAHAPAFSLSGDGWHLGGLSQISIYSDLATPETRDSGGLGPAWAVTNVGVSDVNVSALLEAGHTGIPGLIARCDPTLSTLVYAFIDSGGTTWNLVTSTNGAFTTLDSKPITTSPGIQYLCTLSCIGSTITASFNNGATVLSATSTFNLTQTRCGFSGMPNDDTVGDFLVTMPVAP